MHNSYPDARMQWLLLEKPSALALESSSLNKRAFLTIIESASRCSIAEVYEEAHNHDTLSPTFWLHLALESSSYSKRHCSGTQGRCAFTNSSQHSNVHAC